MHRLVLSAFYGPCPEGMIGCHNNGISHDNRIENLRWDTYASNTEDMLKHGTARIGTKNTQAKLTEEIVSQAKKRRSEGRSVPEMASEIGVDRSTLRRAVYGKSWRHVV